MTSDPTKSPESVELKDDLQDIPEEYRDEISDDVESLSEEKLLQRKIDFDEEAMPHMNILHGYALKITGNQLDADDLVQETFLRAFRFFDKFEKQARENLLNEFNTL